MEQTTNKNEYRTGDTRPPKSYRGMIALLLIAVILLCGIVSALGLMNMRLWQQLQVQQQEDDEDSVYFSRPAQVATVKEAPPVCGFTGHGIDAFWQSYSHLPAGVYITKVDPASAAYAAGLREGDVVLCVDGKTVEDMQTVEKCLQNKVGIVSVQLSRNGHLMMLNLYASED